MKLYDAVFVDPVPVAYKYGMIALILIAAVLIVAGVILLLLRRRRKGAGKGKKEGPAEK
jgi:hypothetical protein